MKQQRFFLFATVIALLFSLTSCKEVIYFENDYMEVQLTDEQFFGAPELIMKATAESIETEYFTNPDGEAYENAHVTVFNLKISELYKGEWEQETFQLKMFNGKGMSSDLYLYGEDDDYILAEKEDPFLLEIGKEYILGVSYLDPERYNCYKDPGGYAIKMGKDWTFTLNENGSYENMEGSSEHREFDIPTLKAKIAALQ